MGQSPGRKLILTHLQFSKPGICLAGAQCWICQIFPGGRIGPIGWGVRRGSPGEEGTVPPPQKILVFDLKTVNFGVF